MQFVSRARLAALVAAVFVTAWANGAQAATLKTLYSFCSLANCTDGSNPGSALLMDSSGNLYGTATSGGVNVSFGAAYELVKSGKGWKYRRIYSFCTVGVCSDGKDPTGGLIMDVAGDLYGTTRLGGSGNQGIAFELIPNVKHTKWKLKTLYNFCTVGFCTDGANPQAGLSYAGAASGALYDGTSPLYGTAPSGGSDNGGVVFQLAPHGNKWRETVLHNLCGTTRCADGSEPIAPVTVDSHGNLFGTTVLNGVNGGGVVFELSLQAKKWTETVLHAFCATFQNNRCQDGNTPLNGALLIDGTGNLFGTTQNGGSQAGGTAFKLAPNGASSELTTLYNFCSLASCADGSAPQGDLSMDSSGNLYGVANTGGANGHGAIYRLNGTLAVLYSFCAQTNCTDGTNAQMGVIRDGSGDLLGTTIKGGADNEGSAFELTP